MLKLFDLKKPGANGSGAVSSSPRTGPSAAYLRLQKGVLLCCKSLNRDSVDYEISLSCLHKDEIHIFNHIDMNFFRFS